MKVQKIPKPFDVLTHILRTEELSNALAEFLPFSVSDSKFYVWAPETGRSDSMVMEQELYRSMLDDKQNI